MENIIVIEICEREICTVTPCDTMEEAIDAANELLHTHCNITGYGDELDEAIEEAKKKALSLAEQSLLSLPKATVTHGVTMEIVTGMLSSSSIKLEVSIC